MARRLLLCPINHHLVDWRVFARATCAIITGALWRQHEQQPPPALLLKRSIYRVSFPLSPLLGASQPLYDCAQLLRSADSKGLRRFKPRRVRQVFFPCVSSQGLISSAAPKPSHAIASSLLPQFLSTLGQSLAALSISASLSNTIPSSSFSAIFLGLGFRSLSLPVFA